MKPVPPHFTHDAEPLCLLKTGWIVCWFVDYIRTIAFFEADANLGSPGFWTWYGSHTRLATHSVSPSIGFPNCFPVFGSHARIVLSIVPVAVLELSSEQLTANTQLVCLLVSQSHILAVLSPDPLNILDEDLSENCGARIASPCPVSLKHISRPLEPWIQLEVLLRYFELLPCWLD